MFFNVDRYYTIENEHNLFERKENVQSSYCEQKNWHNWNQVLKALPIVFRYDQRNYIGQGNHDNDMVNSE